MSVWSSGTGRHLPQKHLSTIYQHRYIHRTYNILTYTQVYDIPVKISPVPFVRRPRLPKNYTYLS